MSLTTIDRVKAALGIPAGITYHDGAIANVVAAANAYVLDVLDQPGGLIAHTRTEYLRAYSPGQRYVMLGRSPVRSVIAVTVDGSPMDPDEYVVDEDTGALHARGKHANWSTVPGGIEVTYLHGYTDADDVDALRVAADQIAAHMHTRGRHAGTAGQRLDQGVQVTTDGAGIPTTAAAILRRYRRSSV